MSARDLHALCSTPATRSLRRTAWGLSAGLLLLAGAACGDFTIWGVDGPTAVATADPVDPASCETETVTLDGSGSTPVTEGATLAYVWEFTSKPSGSSATIANSTTVTATFSPDSPGEYVIQLAVTEVETGNEAVATTSVTVNAASTPLADLQASPASTTPGNTVTLDAGGSQNPLDGCTSGGLTLTWTLSRDGEDVSDLLQATEDPEVMEFNGGGSPAPAGAYTATLQAGNTAGSDTDTATVVISEEAGGLDDLEGGDYGFDLLSLQDGVYGGTLEGYFEEDPDSPFPTVEVTVTGTVPVPDTPPAQGAAGFEATLTLAGTNLVGSVEGPLDLTFTNEDGTVYAVTGEASLTASSSLVAGDCRLDAVIEDGTLAPGADTQSVSLIIPLSGVTVDGTLCETLNLNAPDAGGTITLTLDGARQG